jgi:hypothetical protein
MNPYPALKSFKNNFSGKLKLLADPKLRMLTHACLHKVFTNFAEIAV